MARIYARKKGRSSSTRPYKSEDQDWIQLTPAEIEDLVVTMAEEGIPPAMIGIRLRDQHAVPQVKGVTGKKITEILEEKGIKPQIPEDLKNLILKALSLSSHLKSNPKDLHNRRALHLTESKIRRLERYYKREGVLPPDWKYDLTTAKLMVE